MKKVVCFRVKTITLQYPYILKLNQINFSHHRDSNIMQTVKYNSITSIKLSTLCKKCFISKKVLLHAIMSSSIGCYVPFI